MSYRATRGALIRSLVGAALVLGLVHADARATDAPSNLELMTSLTKDVVADLLARIEDERGGRAIQLKPFANTEEYIFISNVISSSLSERGVTIYQKPSARSDTTLTTDALELQFQALEFSVDYPRIFRSHLIGGKRVRRQADVTIITTLVEPRGGAVLSVDEASREASDQFAHGDIDRVEEGTFQFLRPAMPSSGWGKVVEPVFVSGIVVGLIYLFFSNQSDN